MGRFRSGNNRGFGGNRSGGRSRRPGGGFGGDRPRRRFDDSDSGGFERRRPEMHEAICDKCGKNCEVPFRPTEGKPILCSDCFRKEDGGSSRKKFGFVPRSNSASSGISQEQYKEINKKLDKILGILEMIEFEEDSDEEDEDEEDGDEESSEEDQEESESSENNSKDESESEEKSEEESSEEDKEEN